MYGFNLGYTPYTGCQIYSEKNYFDKGDYKGAVVDDKGVGGFTDVGSVLSPSSVSNLSTGSVFIQTTKITMDMLQEMRQMLKHGAKNSVDLRIQKLYMQ